MPSDNLNNSQTNEIPEDPTAQVVEVVKQLKRFIKSLDDDNDADTLEFLRDELSVVCEDLDEVIEAYED